MADIVGSVDDLLIQILFHVPIKSLMRFKLVSTQWKSLITSHRFTSLYRPTPPVVGLILPERVGPTYPYIPLNVKTPMTTQLLPYRDKMSIQQSCNGLLLCCSMEPFCRTPALGTLSVLSCCVYNPTTRCAAQIPTPPGGLVHALYLAFDPAESPFYRVVCVRGTGLARKPFRIETYSSESGAWRACGEPFRAEKARFEYGVYWNKSMHWINHERKEILYFNLDGGGVGKVALPAVYCIREYDGVDFDGYFGESRGRLHVTNWSFSGGEVKDVALDLDVYEMKSDYSEWLVKRFCFRVESWRENYYYRDIKFHVLTVVRVEGEGSFAVVWVDGEVFQLTLDCNNTFEKIFDMRFRATLVWEYMETLASV